MTSETPAPTERRLLEIILHRMNSIDRSVEEILDSLTDHFADTAWYRNGYDLRPNDEDNGD